MDNERGQIQQKTPVLTEDYRALQVTAGTYR